MGTKYRCSHLEIGINGTEYAFEFILVYNTTLLFYFFLIILFPARHKAASYMCLFSIDCNFLSGMLVSVLSPLYLFN